MLLGRRAWGKPQRLLRASEFAGLSLSQAHWRASRRWIAMSAQLHSPIAHPPEHEAPRAGVRFGITVSRHQARRAVARNCVKRVLREAARNGAAQLQAAAKQRRVDILLRLKASLPDPAAATWSSVKAQLRREADSLIAQLHRQLLAQSAQDSAEYSAEHAPPRAVRPGGAT